MIVECPACHTRYRINDSAALSENSVFECTQDRCHQRFPCPPELLKSGASDPQADPAPSLSDPPEGEFSTAKSSISQPTTKAAPLAPTRESFESFDQSDEFSLLDEEEPLYPAADLHHFREIEMEDEPSVPFRSRGQPPSGAILPHKVVFGFFGLLVLAYALLGVYSLTHIAQTEALLAQLPVIGPRFIADQFSAQNITLSDLKSSIWVTKDSKRVLAIAGKATNTAPVPATVIQIEGTLFDANGKVVGQQQTFCGTETAAEILPNLTTREIGILQNLAPPKQFNVASGKSINFLIVFVTPPVTISELSCRVVTAQFRTP